MPAPNQNNSPFFFLESSFGCQFSLLSDLFYWECCLMRRYGYSSAPVAHPESSAGYSGVIIPFLLTLAWGNRVFHYNQNQFPSTHQLIRGRYLKEDEDWKKTPNAFLAKRKASRFGIFCCIGPSWVSEETYAIFGASSATRNEPKGDGGFLI